MNRPFFYKNTNINCIIRIVDMRKFGTGLILFVLFLCSCGVAGDIPPKILTGTEVTATPAADALSEDGVTPEATSAPTPVPAPPEVLPEPDSLPEAGNDSEAEPVTDLNEESDIPSLWGGSGARPGINKVVFTDFDLNFGQLSLKYGDVTDASYWAGGAYVMHEYGLGAYFYEYGDNDLYDDITPDNDARLNFLYCAVTDLLVSFDGELGMSDLRAIFGTEEISFNYDASGESSTDEYLFLFTYQDFTLTVSCDENGVVSNRAGVTISRDWW